VSSTATRESGTVARLEPLSLPQYNLDVPTPVAALTFLGILIVVLGLFVAGNLTVVIVGLVAICSAGVLEALARRRVG